MIHINGVGYCNESGAQMAVNDLLKVNQQQAEQIEMLQQGLQFDKELADHLRVERDRLLVSRDAPAEENARLLFLLEQCLPFIKADAAQHGGKLAYEITKAINRPSKSNG